ncbi:MAG: hypothetical protein CMC38_06775 [Flavobacteriaceae bacterium]|nr:hypothetical protein [Flavobacteriaceae bacterium]
MRKILFSLLFLFSGLVFSQTKPMASDVSAAHFKDTNGLIHLVGSDAEFNSLTYTIITLPSHGTLKDPNNSNSVVSAGGSLTGNSVTFVPDSEENHKYIFSGTNSFTYKVTDSDGDSDIKTVKVEVFDSYLNPPTAIGSEINGEGAGDNFGRAVSLSEDGTIMAVGAPFNDAGTTDSDKGSVRVYKLSSDSGWTKLGDDIDGTNDQDYFGSSVSLSGDGTILAVGIPYNDTANSNAGQVKVYQYDSANSTWNIMSTITPTIVSSGSNKAVSEQFGNDVRLSSDGKTLAVSDIWFDRSGGNNSGRVVVYRYDGTNWNSLGNETAIYGESGDNLSWGLSLSSNGNIMAVGVHDYSSNNKGQVKIFEYDSANTQWNVKETLLGDKSAEKFGAAVDLSSDGLIVAVGAPYHRVAGSGSEFVGKVSIYKWDGSNYTALGSDLIGSDKYDYFGAHLSLDNEGNTLAVMGPGHDANSGSSSGSYLNKGRVRVFNYDIASTSWIQSPVSYDFDGEADEDQSTGSNNESKGQRVFLSGNGSVLAIGADENDGNGTNSGHVRVYKLFQPQVIPVANSQDVSFTLYEQVTSTDEITLIGTDSDGNDIDLVYIITELNTAKLFEGGTEITSANIPHTLTANKIKYNSNSDVVVNDSFKFIVHDTKASSVPATVTLTIIPDNDPPVATGQSTTSDEDVAKDIDLAGTDVDNADTNLNFLIYSLPTNGTLTDKNNGNSAVTLVNKDSGTTTSANSDKLEDSSQNFTSTVIPGDFLINTTDNTYADIKAVDSDTTLSLSSDIMASGEEYTIKRGSSLVVSSGTAKVTYTPNSNFAGSDSFKFKARDKGVGDDELTDVENSVDAATVSITVNNTDNDPPVAQDQTLSTNEETETGTITLVAVDPDPNDTNLTYTIAVLPANGKLKDGGTEITTAGDISGALTYLPNANFSGNDTFKFTAKDDESTPAVSNQATVTINVGNLNDAPVATAQSVTVDEDTENDITHAGTDPDGDSLTYIIITLPAKGILKDNGTEIVSGDLPKTLSSAKATYIPQTNYNGADSYTFKVNDGTVDSTVAATVDITVKEVNDPPIANSQNLKTDEDTSLTVKFTGSDIENDPLTYLIKSLPSNGKLKDGNTEILSSELPKLLPADSITYVPNANFVGDDSFDFLVNANYLNSFTKANNLKYITQNGVPVTYQKPEGKTYFLIQENTGVSGSPIDWTTARTLTNSIKGAKMYVILNAQMELLVWNGLKSMGLTGKSGLYYWIGLYQDKTSPDYAEPGLETQNWGGWTWVDGVTLKDRGYQNWYNYPSEPNNAGAEDYAQFEFSSNGPDGIKWNDMSIGNAQSWPLFEFSISSSTQSAPAKISIKVESVNDAPVANAQTITTSEDVTTPAAITLTGTDPESQPLTYIVTAIPNNGTLKEGGTAITNVDLPKTLSGNALTYSPEPDYNGNDALTFKVNDGVNESASAIVSIIVNPVNDPPEADDQTVNTDEDVAVDITHVGRDKDLINIFTKHTQIGSNINLGNGWGEFIEISADGETMVIGGWTNNKVKVYGWNGTDWNQLGSDIDGSDSGDDFGEFVSISSNGKRIAVGAHKHDSNRGHVRAFDWDGTSWTEAGTEMEGSNTSDEQSYRGVHISGDGNAVAAASFKGGYVDTYKWDGTKWDKTGVISIPTGGGDSPGQVSLSVDGNRLAIGTGTYSGNKGQVKIFDWDGTNTWNQFTVIDGKNSGEKFGNTLSISRDGKKVAVGVNGAGSARVYDLSASTVTQVGTDINYGSGSAWRAISLSDDGNRIAIPILDQKIGVFDWDGSKWNQLGDDLGKPAGTPGLWGESLDMSGDGKTLVVGGHTGFIRAHKILNLTYIITSLPSNGILKEGAKTITASDLPFTLKDTDATYVPNSGFYGQDKYNFKLNDGKADSNIATVTINIKEFVLNLPLSNYKITTTETCKGFAYGIIDIEVTATSYKKTAAGPDIPITYNIAIQGKGQVGTIVSPNKTAQIKDLPEGTHKLIFTVVGQPKYQQIIDVQIIATDPPVAYVVGKIENCDDDVDGDDTNGKVNFDTSSILDKLLKNPSTGILQDKNLFDFEFTYYDETTSANVTNASLPNPFYSASQTVSVKFKSKINGKCEANQTIDFVVNTLPQIKRIEDTKSVCTNLPPVTIGVTNADNRKYTYTWTRNGTNFPPNITGVDSSILIGLGGEYVVTATTNDGTNCSRSMKITMKESSIATLLRTDIVIKDLLAGPNNTITVKTATLGIGDYEYALDDQTGPYQDEPVFNKVRPGKHTVYVRDKNGCGVVNMDVWVIGYKKFFTPNGDGYTDKWNIIGITKDYQARSKIYIFDRFEKLLKELDPLSPGWDGTFNGKPMPQTDYWFKVILEDGRMFKGHFSLIRAW